MRLVTMAAATAVVLAGFTGSMTAAAALSVPDLLDPAPMPVPLESLLPGLPGAGGGPTKLTVTYSADEKAKPRVMLLECEPTGGDHPRAAEACGLLADAAAAGEDPFAATAPDQACTMIYGGPQSAAVAGTWNGSAVKAVFSRLNGCEIARWDAVEPVLSPEPPG